ncbi:hypothetical protein AFK72_10305 [Corynebacterium ulcerans]|uniref:VanW family protein n=1 Tax=Corynebacterium ulcerans TaxID=65058 RepID=UPI0006BB6B56|nr:VanW family protein [Corynebacterium ulcerans]KPH74106.1 hypothetical protein AFK72_10305 [Corynebacterium ulcerans]OIS05693.1 hypothetical protein BHG00_08480 [Corynebacterium ulcerans]
MSSKKAAKFGAGVVLGIALLGGVGYGTDYVINQGSVPRGTSVGGINIGGMDKDEAISTLKKGLALSAQVQITAGEQHSSLSPEASGLGVDWEKTIDGAGAQSANPFTRLASFFTTHEINIVSTVDEAKLTPQLDRVEKELTPAPQDASLDIHGGKVNSHASVNGQSLSRQELNSAVVSDWLKPDGVNVKVNTTKPAIGESALKKAEETANAALQGPLVLHGRDNIDGFIPVERLAEVLTFVPDNDSLRPDINVEAAKGIFLENLGVTEVKRQNANIIFRGGTKTVTPSVDGITIDWEKTLENFHERVTSKDKRIFDAVYIDEPATFTTEQAERATFDEVVGEFTTGGYSQASGVNIARVAEMVNGAIVAPGDTFSLNGYTGPRGRAQGFVESGVILNGRADKAVGGGISQFATTLYNASYFAGMQDVAHTNHSFYISRYPAGREATVYEGAIDLQFKNTSPYPVRIVTSAGGGNVTVKLTGVKTVNVESINGGRWNYTPPRPIRLSGPDCTPSGGAQGFTTSDTRIVRDLSGNQISRETTTTVYDPSPIVTCS